MTWKWTFGKCWLFCDYCFFLASSVVDRVRCKWTGRSAVGVNYENERFTVVCSRCRRNLKIRNFTLSFGRWRQGIVLKCVLHVQHDYFSSFNQSSHWFVAFSLTLTLPSWNLKLPKIRNFTLSFGRYVKELYWSAWRTCSTCFGANCWRSPPDDKKKFSYLRFWQQRDPTAINLSFFALAWKPLCLASQSALRLFCATWPAWNNSKTAILRDNFVVAAIVASLNALLTSLKTVVGA